MLKNIEETTGVKPKAILNKPELHDHLLYCWSLFAELDRFRVYTALGTFSKAGPIPLGLFLQYAQLYQFTRREAQENWELVSLIDRIWIELYENRQEAPTGSK